MWRSNNIAVVVAEAGKRGRAGKREKEWSGEFPMTISSTLEGFGYSKIPTIITVRRESPGKCDSSSGTAKEFQWQFIAWGKNFITCI